MLKNRAIPVFGIFFLLPTLLFASSLVRINEVAPDEGSFDWIELYVATDTINLNGWRVQACQSSSVIDMKTLPNITTGWAYIVIHCTNTASPPADEVASDTNGNGYWDVYVGTDIFTGLRGTDNIRERKSARATGLPGRAHSNP